MTAEHYWVKLAIKYILYHRKYRYDYPYILPYSEIINRAIEIESMFRKIMMWNAWQNFGVGAILSGLEV